MKMLKKLLALTLAVIMLLSMTACHKKDEIALTVNGIEIKSGLYAYALFEADMQARNEVDTNLESTESDTEDVDYYSQSIDGVKFETYVKEEALKKCQEFAFYQTLINDGVISLTDEELESADSVAEYYWDSYGYSAYYEPNGIGYETFKLANRYSYYANEYFMYLYDEGGEKEVAKDERNKYLTDNFQLAYLLSTTYDEDATDDEIAQIKNNYKNYEERLKNGESFETIYYEEYPDQAETDTTESDTSSDTTSEESTSSVDETSSETETTEEEEETPTPKDAFALALVDPNSDIAEYYSSSYYGAYADSNYDKVLELEKGETLIIEAEDDTSISLYVKLDISSDEYYLTANNENILVVLKQEEYDSYIAAIYTEYTVDESSYATKRFKVKNIVYPETTTA